MSAAEPVESARGVGRGASFVRVGVAYVIALAAALATGAAMASQGVHAQGLMRGYSLLAFADLSATLVVFFASLAVRNSSMYDPYWMVVPPLFSLGYWAMGAPTDPRSLLHFALVLVWAIRLTFNWVRGWGGLDYEDFRYRDMQKKFGTGPLYWLISLSGLHFFPTVLVLFGLLPTAAIYSGGAPLSWLDFVGAAIMLAGIVLELVADEQLRGFVKARTDRDAICDVGLWSWSRHPNYFGEVLFWLGPVLLSLASGAFAWWMAVGAVAMVLLFFLASIPMMERRQSRKPAYAAYQRRTSMLIPMPPRR